MKHIIIAGTNKAATTSLFRYLSDHPDVCGSYIKQTNYFLDKEIQKKHELSSVFDYDKSHDNYQNFFKCDPNKKFKLEASPDYMYYANTAKKINLFLNTNNGKVVIILRNPVTRFKSWFRFGKQQGLLNEEIDFDNYYKLSKAYNKESNLSLLAFKTGFYSNYLNVFKEHLKEHTMHVFFYEDLVNNPKLFLNQFCEKLGIDKEFYEGYEFQHFNKTVKVKSRLLSKLYVGLRQFYLNYFYKGKVGVFIGSIMKKTLSPIYKKVNTSSEKTDVQEKVLEELTEDYKGEKLKIQKMFNLKNIPW
ncbi:MAG: sulfotransferase [Bacteroidia bacterium]|nr:sulfotransferase [Bacteroidia bacterium]